MRKKKKKKEKERKKLEKNSIFLSLSLSFLPLARQLYRVPLDVPDPGDEAVVLLGEGVLQGVAALVEERFDLVVELRERRGKKVSFFFFFPSALMKLNKKAKEKTPILTSRNVIRLGLSPTGGVELRTMWATFFFIFIFYF